MRRFPFTFENLGPPGDPHRDPAQIERELRAQANEINHDPARRPPKAIGLCEALGYRLPRLNHHGNPIRDTSRPGRANLALYTLDRFAVDHAWIDLAETWPRTEHGGTHPPRSILVAQIEEWWVIVGHAPPIAPHAGDARAEWRDAMRHALVDTPSDAPVLALTDPNGLGLELMRVPGVVTGGTPVEAVHARRVTLTNAQAVGSLNGVEMLTDHRRVLVGHARKRDR